MSGKYGDYCMDFTNEELKKYLIDVVTENANVNLDIRLFSEDDTEIDIDSDRRIESIVFDGKNDNLMILFLKSESDIFMYDFELMFIDEDSKGTVTSSDTDYNAVYEGKLREMSHEQILTMFAEIILCFAGATDIKMIQLDVPEDKHYKKYNYYTPYMFTINVENDHATRQTKVYENITINY